MYQGIELVFLLLFFFFFFFTMIHVYLVKSATKSPSYVSSSPGTGNLPRIIASSKTCVADLGNS